ncbi:NADAR family protein [bacterium]|nr:NADAR family protein [bacterium]
MEMECQYITHNSPFVFFWRGKFSQWVKHPLLIDGVEYCCCEQYMMYQKALIFNDLESAEKIMSTSSPRQHQLLGREIKNFEQSVWDSHKFAVVYKGNYYKYKQNEELKNLLFSFPDNSIFVEASPIDKVWGVGRSVEETECSDPSKWLGINLLGNVLTSVRSVLKNEENL